MRYDAEHKERTRARVLEQAAIAIRLEGPQQIGVKEVMAKAGLTHGGFYAHFTSKEDLVAAAMAQMFDEAVAIFEKLAAKKEPAIALRDYVDFYLSPRHRDMPEQGCPLPSISADVHRLGPPAQASFEHGVNRLTAAFASCLASLRRAEPKALASSALAEMVGALSLARGIADRKKSDALLDHSRKLLKRRLGLRPLS
ncbi:transcriptional regulator, TetR family [Rhizobiales bacterium GAS191]|jgi:TetR/AcrR family transcriptional repressor of nem operon|nr:transcriptional regulator, TetR family [Rhizobiales bacterium GAS113]SED73149.1 transcriptional regulator, TetR family [Rhizobiales bacterium GAS188]SEE80604.1 transcriptional regulator, TetR family [Rhizobiales bacterium GAS191]